MQILDRWLGARRAHLLNDPRVRGAADTVLRALATLPAPAADLICTLLYSAVLLVRGIDSDEEARVRRALDCPPARARGLIRRQHVLTLLGQVDLYRWHRAPDRHARMVRRENEGYLLDALARGRGVVVVSIHTVGLAPGAWPLAAFVERRGATVSIVTETSMLPTIRAYPPAFDDLSAVRGLVGELKAGGLVLVLGDALWYPGRRVAVRSYLNAECRFPVGPVAIARLAQATILPAVALREGAGQYVARFFPPIEPPARNDAAGDAAVIDVLAPLFEEVVRAHPDQYLLYPWRAAESGQPNAAPEAGRVVAKVTKVEQTG